MVHFCLVAQHSVVINCCGDFVRDALMLIRNILVHGCGERNMKEANGYDMGVD